jgi:hypothetical protein
LNLKINHKYFNFIQMLKFNFQWDNIENQSIIL